MTKLPQSGWLPALTILSCAITATFNTSAQTAPVQLPEYIERITTTGSRHGVDDSDAPLIISAVGQQDINLVSPTHIEEVLKFIAGAQVQRGNGQEYLPALRSQVFI